MHMCTTTILLAADSFPICLSGGWRILGEADTGDPAEDLCQANAFAHKICFRICVGLDVQPGKNRKGCDVNCACRKYAWHVESFKFCTNFGAHCIAKCYGKKTHCFCACCRVVAKIQKTVWPLHFVSRFQDKMLKHGKKRRLYPNDSSGQV